MVFSEGDGALGWPDVGPFDGIIVAAAPETVPEALVEQLADGGRMVIPVGANGGQTLKLIERHGANTSEQLLLPVSFVPLV